MPGPLILVPTPFELKTLEPLLATPVEEARGAIEICGFGVITAAARTAQLIAAKQPSRVLLVGIAGSLAPDLRVGSASTFAEVACHGIGVGSGEQHTGASALGWEQWSGGDEGTSIGGRLSLDGRDGDRRLLLSVCAASADEHDADQRRKDFPNASAEDMEGFAVAVACKLAGVPLQIVRGISNVAGDRDKNHWKIADALRAAARLATNLIASHE